RAMHEVAERLERRGLVIILSDFFADGDEIRSGLAHLRHERHEVVAVRVLDGHELDFRVRNRDRFSGWEGEGGRLIERAVLMRACWRGWAGRWGRWWWPSWREGGIVMWRRGR